jgi:hypothetical protein
MASSSDDYVRIFDTTQRNGEPSPGASMTRPDDFRAVQCIADRVSGPTICGLTRANERDIDRAWGRVQHSLRDEESEFVSHSCAIDPELSRVVLGTICDAHRAFRQGIAHHGVGTITTGMSGCSM